MVWTDAVSQDAGALRGLAAHYGVPVLSVHAPCLLVTQRVWSPDPWERLRRAAELAETLGAPTVVVHPPFTWQRDYARNFAEGLAAVADRFPGLALRGGEHVPGADGGPAVRPVRARLGSDRAPATRRTRWTCRTARPRTATRWRWPTGWAPGWRTCTSATAPARAATSTWCPAGAPSPARELLSSLAGRGFTGVGGGGGRHPGREEPRGARGGPARRAGVRPPAPDRVVAGRRLTRRPTTGRRRQLTGESESAPAVGCGATVTCSPTAARLRARCAATCERVAQRSEQNRRQQLDDVSR